MIPSNRQVFFSLLYAGLWEQPVQLSCMGEVDFDDLFRVAEEQSVVGLVAAGLEHVVDRKITKPQALPFMKKVFATETRNADMNRFVADLFIRLREAGIQAVLVKGQGIAQCYERPQWRSAGDVDLLLDAENYEKAKSFLSPLASSIDKEIIERKHLGMTIDSWEVELHGTLRGHISIVADALVDQVQAEMFSQGAFRIWKNGGTDIPLPAPDSDVVFIFSHILQHFYGGIGLRQVCDWVRLLWTYRDSINRNLLESRIRSMRMMTEWKAFAALAVDYLGMPTEAMPLYDSSARWKRKAHRISASILRSGNFGHNRRDDSIYTRYPYLVYKTISLGRHIGDFFEQLLIFPLDSLRPFVRVIAGGLKAVARGE